MCAAHTLGHGRGLDRGFRGFCSPTVAPARRPWRANRGSCAHQQIPSPPSISDEELALVIAHGDNSRFSVPMSVSDGHTEVDNGTAARGARTSPVAGRQCSTRRRPFSPTAGVACTAYDVLVNSHVLSTLDEREGMREFLLELIIAHIEIKHSVALNRGAAARVGVGARVRGLKACGPVLTLLWCCYPLFFAALFLSL